MNKVLEKTEIAGGTIVKIAPQKYKVFAPDGRLVGKFRTFKEANAKAQHWDKWDVLSSLQDICVTIAPFTTLLLMSILLNTLKDKNFKAPTDEEVSKIMAMDTAWLTLQQLRREGKIDDTTFEKTLTAVAEKLSKEKCYEQPQ